MRLGQELEFVLREADELETPHLEDGVGQLGEVVVGYVQPGHGVEGHGLAPPPHTRRAQPKLGVQTDASVDQPLLLDVRQVLTLQITISKSIGFGSRVIKIKLLSRASKFSK